MASGTRQLKGTNFTSVIHDKPYETISLARPELSQKGRTVLVTGGAINIGFSIARSFVRAGAESVIIIGRRQDALDDAALKLEKEGSSKILTLSCDQADTRSVQTMWTRLAQRNILVDVLVLNAADFVEEKPILELGRGRLWEAYVTNVRGLLDMVEAFNAQHRGGPKAIVNVSTNAINGLYEHQLKVSADRPAYGLTKNAGNMLLSQIAKDTDPQWLQIVNFHPGLLYNDQWKNMGYEEKDPLFDDANLPGCFAVWASTKEAAFLHGRFVWASWNIDEYSSGSVRKRIDEDPSYLTVGVVGLDGAFKL